MTLDQLLAAHRFVERTSISEPSRCYCGWVGHRGLMALGRDTWIEWATHVSAETDKDRTVTTVQQLDALPTYTIVRDADGDALQKDLVLWWCGGIEVPTRSEDVSLPARILWFPPDETGA